MQASKGRDLKTVAGGEPVSTIAVRSRKTLLWVVVLLGVFELFAAAPARADEPAPANTNESLEDSFDRQWKAMDEDFKRKTSAFDKAHGGSPKPAAPAAATPSSQAEPAAATSTSPPDSFEQQQQNFRDDFDRQTREFDENFKRGHDEFQRELKRRQDNFSLLFWIAFPLIGSVGIGWWLYTVSRRARVQKHKPDLLAEQARTVAAELGGASVRAAGVLGGYVAKQPLTISAEDRAVVIGPPGTGKTAFLVSQLLQWAEQKRSFVCLDIKPEIHGITRERLEALGYEVLTFNPTQGTGQHYNPLDDVESPEGLGELAAALIPGEDLKDAVFYESARDFLDAVVSHLRATEGKASLVDVRAFLGEAEGFKELMQKLLESPDPDVRDIAGALMLTAANNRLIGSICAQLRANLRFVRYPKVRESLEHSDFSLRALCGEKPVALFLQFEEQHRETTARLLAAMVAHVMRFFITNHQRPPVLLLLDEIGTAPVIPALVQKLNTIRSRHLPTWMYWQSLEQMQRYGEKQDEGPNIILGACDMQMVFRLNDNASAQWMSDRIGKVDRVVEATSVQIGAMAQKSRTLVTEPLVWPHELQSLAASEVVCTYRGKTWRGEAKPYYELWPEYRGRPPTAPRGAAYARRSPEREIVKDAAESVEEETENAE